VHWNNNKKDQEQPKKIKIYSELIPGWEDYVRRWVSMLRYQKKDKKTYKIIRSDPEWGGSVAQHANAFKRFRAHLKELRWRGQREPGTMAFAFGRT